MSSLESFNSISPLVLHLRSLIANLFKKKPGKSLKNDILSLVAKLGSEGEKTLLQILLESLDLKEMTGSSREKGQIPKPKVDFFLQRLNICIAQPSFVDYFGLVCEQVAAQWRQSVFEMVSDMVRMLKLNSLQCISIGLACFLAVNKKTSEDGARLLKKSLQEYFSLGKVQILPDYLHHALIVNLRSCPEFKELSVELKFLLDGVSYHERPNEFKPVVSPHLYHLLPGELSNEDPSLTKQLGHYLKPWELLEELLQNSFSSSPAFFEVFNEFPAMSEDDILECVIMMSNTYPILEDSTQRMLMTVYSNTKNNSWNKPRNDNNDKKSITWNIEIFIKTANEIIPNLKWSSVLKRIDRPGLRFKDQKSFVAFLKFFQKCKKTSNFIYPSSLILEPWANLHAQMHFIMNLLQSGQPDLIFWSELNKRVVALDFNPNFKYNTLTPQALQFWGCLELLDLLIYLSETEYYLNVRSLFELPLQKCPDMLLVGLAQIKRKSSLLDELFSQLFPLYLLNHSNSIPILESLWRLNQSLMITAIFELYRKENSSLNLSRVLDITQEIKDSLMPIANCNEYAFSVSLGLLASKREFLHFEHWITDRIKTIGNNFISAILKHLEENILIPCAKCVESAQTLPQTLLTSFETILDKAQLTLESFAIIFDNLLVVAFEKLSPKNKKKAQELYKEACKYYPTLENASENAKLEVDSAANKYFQKIYDETMSVEEVVELLAKFKNSQNPTEKEIFACMIHYLFDEFRFHDDYPMKQLKITGKLYGLIINNRIIDGSPLLDLAINCVKISLERFPGKRFEFGKIALDHFKTRVIEYSNYFQSLFLVDQIREKAPEILLEIKILAESMGKPLDIKPEILAMLNLKASSSENSNLMNPPTQAHTDDSFKPGVASENQDMRTTNVQLANTLYPNQTPDLPPQMQPQVLYSSLRNEGAYSADFIQKNMMAQGGNPSMLDNVNYSAFTNQQIMSLQTALDPMNQLQMGLMAPQFQPVVQPIVQPVPINQPALQNLNPGNHLHKVSKTPDPNTNPNPAPLEKVAPQVSNMNMLSDDMDASNVPEEVQSRLTFLLNNLEINKMDERMNEFRTLLENDSVQKWFSKILVYKRAAQENINLSTMLANYSALMNKMNKKSLYSQVTRDTYACIHKYLNMPLAQSDKINQRKNILKNLGIWLGQLTLKREKPIVLKYLNLKTLLFDACQNNKLQLVLPLVCKILEQSKDTVVFKPKNPWLSVILGLLCEIKSLTDIKTSTCFEIQVLFHNLSLEEGSIQPTDFLSPGKLNQKLYSMINQGQKLSPVHQVNIPKPQMQPFVQPILPQQKMVSPLENSNNTAISPPSTSGFNNSSGLKIAQLPEYITIDDKNLSVYTEMGINLKIIVAQAVETAIKDIIPPVVSRSVTIALITTRQLALKDFSLEPDERKILRGTHLIVQNLSGSLALVTCREPLRVALCSYLKDNLTEQTSLDEESIDKIVQITSLDNLDLGCALIKKAVIEKALEDVNNDQIILDILKKRRIAREKGENYYDDNYVKMTQFLPEALRPSIRGLTDEQLKIYEDFGTNPKKITQNNNPLYSNPGNFSNNQINMRGPVNKKEIEESEYDKEMLVAYKLQVIERFQIMLIDLEQSLDNTEMLSPAEFQLLLKQTEEFLNSINTSSFDSLSCDLALKILELLFTQANKKEKVTFFLDQLKILRRKAKQSVQSLDKVLKDYIQKLPRSVLEDEKKINEAIFLILINVQLLPLSDLDEILSGLLAKNPNVPNVQNFVVRLMNSLVLGQHLLNPQSLAVIQILQNLLESRDASSMKEAAAFMEDLKKEPGFVSNPSNVPFQAAKKEAQSGFDIQSYLNAVTYIFGEYDKQFYETVVEKFDKWLLLSTENQITAYIHDLESSFVSKLDENFKKFFVYVIDICVNRALDSLENCPNLNNDSIMDYSYIDSFSKLVTIILKTVMGIKNTEILETIFDAFLIVLTKNHEYHKEKFNQRPFFKLLFNLIYDIKRREYNFQDHEINDFFNVFIKLFNKLQPLKYPGFSFSWLELISNSNFMSTILSNNKFTLEYHHLILDLMRFFRRLITENMIEKDFFKTFYKGTLRVLLVLLHDFPEFLSRFAYSFCQDIPEQFIQLRNIILASFPKTMRPPDPFYVNNLEQIEELKQIPVIYTNCFEAKFFEVNLHNDFNNYLQFKTESTFRQIWNKFFYNGNVINVSLVNAFVLIIPWMIYSKSKPNLAQVEEFKIESHILLAKLLKMENLEMREIILNAIFNQISYPNIITNYFIEFILSIFIDFENESIHEQITRVFAERLIIEKPHPWGLIYTFIELIRNSKYNFKKKSNDQIFEAIFSKVFKTIVTNSQDLAN